MGNVLEGWGYVYDAASGELVSEGTVIADPLPANLLLLERAERHDSLTQRWDSTTRDILTYRNVDRIAELNAEQGRITAEIARLESV